MIVLIVRPEKILDSVSCEKTDTIVPKEREKAINRGCRLGMVRGLAGYIQFQAEPHSFGGVINQLFRHST